MSLRQPILYAEEMWRKQRTWVVLLMLLGTGMSVFTLVTRRGSLDGNAAIWLAYVPCALLFGAGLLYYRRRSYVEVTDAGLRISKLLRAVTIPYDAIRGTRVQSLSRHFEGPGRKRYVQPVSRPLLPRPALYIRLKGDEAMHAELQRSLGARFVADDMVAVPIPDPDAMAWEITSRLPDRMGANLGGQRRRKRPR